MTDSQSFIVQAYHAVVFSVNLEIMLYEKDTLPVGTDLSRPSGNVNGDEDVINRSLHNS